eukprot:2966547-Prymnesium_polylepis.1
MASAAGGLLRRLADLAKTKGHQDGTVYGECSTRSFYHYHACAISCAIVVFGEAAAIDKGITARESRLTRGAHAA